MRSAELGCVSAALVVAADAWRQDAPGYQVAAPGALRRTSPRAISAPRSDPPAPASPVLARGSPRRRIASLRAPPIAPLAPTSIASRRPCAFTSAKCADATPPAGGAAPLPLPPPRRSPPPAKADFVELPLPVVPRLHASSSSCSRRITSRAGASTARRLCAKALPLRTRVHGLLEASPRRGRARHRDPQRDVRVRRERRCTRTTCSSAGR